MFHFKNSFNITSSVPFFGKKTNYIYVILYLSIVVNDTKYKSLLNSVGRVFAW